MGGTHRKIGEPRATGTQVIGRAVEALKLIARHCPSGARLSDVATVLQLTKPTAHRILGRLLEEGFLEQEATSKRYRLGLLAFELGLSAAYGPQLVAICRPAIEHLAEASGDSVYLIARSGFDATCIDCVVGSFPIRTSTMTVGGRRALGVGAAGQALLATLDDAQVRDILAANAREYIRFSRLTPEQLWRDMLATRRRGFSITDGRITPGVAGVGMAIPNRDGSPFLAVSIAAISSRMAAARIKDLQLPLRRAVATLSTLLARSSALQKKMP